MGKISVALGVAIAVMVCSVGAADQFPYAGKVNAARVNVRAGAGVSYRILMVAKKDEKVVVRGATGEWLKIKCPAGCKGWVFSKFVSNGVITGDSVNVRATNSTKDVVIGQLNKGDRVQVLRTLDVWSQIVAPEDADAYIFAKYVTNVGNLKVYLKQEKTRKAILDLQGQLEAGLAKEKAGDQASWDIDAYIAGYQRLKTLAESEDCGTVSTTASALADRRLQEMKGDKELVDRLKEAQRKLAEIEAWKNAELANLNKPEPEYTARGWVEDVGPMVNRPGTHRLRMGREPLCFLTSSKYNLYDYVGSLVGIIGKYERMRGRRVLVVEKLDVLHAEKSDF